MVSIRSLVLLGLFVIALQNICVIDDIAVGECTGVGECNGTQVLGQCKEGYGCCLSDTTTFELQSFRYKGNGGRFGGGELQEKQAVL